VSDVDNDLADQKIRTKNLMPLSRQEGLWQYQNLQVAITDLMSSDQIRSDQPLQAFRWRVTSPFLLPGWIFSHLRTLIWPDSVASAEESYPNPVRKWAIKNSRPRCYLPKLHIARWATGFSTAHCSHKRYQFWSNIVYEPEAGSGAQKEAFRQ
jgi:hypothetical protein